jgi:hypothetical protein
MAIMEKSDAVGEHVNATSDSDGYSTEESVVGFETDLNHLPKGRFSSLLFESQNVY